MATPLISICMPCLNPGRFLEERLESILSQTVTDWELIVCDSRSNDGSWELLQKQGDDPRIQLHQVPGEGCYAGWNECLRRARGEYIYIATADDTCRPELLERLVGVLDSFKTCPATGGTVQDASLRSKSLNGTNSPRSVDIAVCNFDYIDEEGRVLENYSAKPASRIYGEWLEKPHIRDGRTEFVLQACMGCMWVTMTTVLFRRSLLERIEMFSTTRGIAADQEWQLRACLQSDIAYVPEKLATWRQHAAQRTDEWRENAYDRGILDGLEAVLRDPDAGVPSAWRTIDGWEETLTRVQRSLYYDSYHLYRSQLRDHPGQFFHAAVRALFREPGLFWKQLGRGFRWDDEFSPDPEKTAFELIELFGCTWPPKAL